MYCHQSQVCFYNQGTAIMMGGYPSEVLEANQIQGLEELGYYWMTSLNRSRMDKPGLKLLILIPLAGLKLQRAICLRYTQMPPAE